MSDQRLFNTILKFAEKYKIDIPPKCSECGGDIIPTGYEDVDDLCAIMLHCTVCKENPYVIVAKDPNKYLSGK
jgi:hypothetical protein